MTKGALIFLIVLALVGTGAWLLLTMGVQPPPSPPSFPGSLAQEDPAQPDAVEPSGFRQPVPGPGPLPEPERRALELRASSPGFGPVTSAGVMALGKQGLVLAEARTGMDGWATLLVPAEIEVGALAVDHPEFVPWRGTVAEAGPTEATLIRAGRIAGLVLGPDGRAALGARIALGGEDAGPFTLVGPDGSYALDRQVPGPVTLTCTFQGHVREVPVQVEAGLETRVDFDFVPSGPLVNGFLLGPSAEPKTGWWVAAEAPEAQFRASCRVEQDGAFHLQLPEPAHIDLLAGPVDALRGTWTHLARYEVTAQGLTGLRLFLGGVGLEGQLVLEGEEGLPDQVLLRVWREDEKGMSLAGSTGELGDDGSFALDGLQPGPYRLEAQALGVPTSLFWLGFLGPGTHAVGTLQLTREGLGELRILCQSKGGPPPESFQLWRREGDTWLPLGLQPLGEHAYLVPAMPAGKQALRVEAEGFVPGELEATIPPGAAFNLTLEFLRGHPVTLAIETPEHRALASLQGRLTVDGPVLEAQSTGPGLWTFSALPPGRVTLLVWADGYQPVRVELQVPAAELPAARVGLRPR